MNAACAATSDGVIGVALCAIVTGLLAGLSLGFLAGLSLRIDRPEPEQGIEQPIKKEHR